MASPTSLGDSGSAEGDANSSSPSSVTTSSSSLTGELERVSDVERRMSADLEAVEGHITRLNGKTEAVESALASGGSYLGTADPAELRAELRDLREEKGRLRQEKDRLLEERLIRLRLQHQQREGAPLSSPRAAGPPPANASCERCRWRAELRVGDRVDARDCVRRWYEGVIVQASLGDGRLVKVHFEGWESRWDQIMDPRGDDIQPLHSVTTDSQWTQALAEGSRLEVLAPVDGAVPVRCHWVLGEVLAVNREASKVKVRQMNDPSSGGRWVAMRSDKICSLGTHVSGNAETAPPGPALPEAVEWRRQVPVASGGVGGRGGGSGGGTGGTGGRGSGERVQ